MDDVQKGILIDLVDSSLDRAEKIWSKEGHMMESINVTVEGMDSLDIVKRAELVPSYIPGSPIVSTDIDKVDTFVALVADMRDSTKHLMCRIATSRDNVTELKRVFYETSALLPALAQTIKFENGSVTEYLGDGILALFKLEDDKKAIYDARRAAVNCLTVTRQIVNEAISKRYSLPGLDLGVGLATSQALVTTVGLSGEMHAKAFGKCIFNATKKSNGRNKIFVDKDLEAIWPTSKGGFTFKKIDDYFELPYNK
ncbi:hypothetical protein RC856_003334 [Vibrio fluvialis]|nr:hypothetical protein [Vibrio fluvialis]MBY7805732.1 hypothetical protein [Vibrio fluvialis]